MDGDGGVQRGGDSKREWRTSGVALGSRVAGGVGQNFGVVSLVMCGVFGVETRYVHVCRGWESNGE